MDGVVEDVLLASYMLSTQFSNLEYDADPHWFEFIPFLAVVALCIDSILIIELFTFDA